MRVGEIEKRWRPREYNERHEDAWACVGETTVVKAYRFYEKKSHNKNGRGISKVDQQ